MKFTASRLSDNNKVFPAEIHTEESGLTVKIPGLFKGKSEYFDYGKISNISVETPIVGFSTITFHAAGAKISAHGFTKLDVRQIKQEIEEGKQPKKIESIIYNEVERPTPRTPKLSLAEELELKKKELELEYLRKEKQLEWDKRMKAEREEEQKNELEKQRQLNELKQKEKNELLQNKGVGGKFIYFWKYTLDKVWKKILFVYIVWMTIYYIYDFIEKAVK